MVDRDFLNWFAGFAAGEGCFYTHREPRITRPAFQINLRDDDIEILRRVRKELNIGTISRHCVNKEVSNPQARWQVCRLTDCQKLVGLLRQVSFYGARKEADFRIWAELVEAKAAGAGRGTLRALARQLSEVKEYIGENQQLPLPNQNSKHPQLRLIS